MSHIGVCLYVVSFIQCTQTTTCDNHVEKLALKTIKDRAGGEPSQSSEGSIDENK